MDIDRGVRPTPDDLDSLLNSDCEIWVFSGVDRTQKIRKRLDLEMKLMPVTNPRLMEDMDGHMDTSNRIMVVHIAGFFTDATDFVYYVKGGVNMTRFTGGTFSGKPYGSVNYKYFFQSLTQIFLSRYDRPCFATPCAMYDASEIFESKGIDTTSRERVSKTDTKGIRWKYLYESAVKAWEKLVFDQGKLDAIEEQLKEFESDGSNGRLDQEDFALFVAEADSVENEDVQTSASKPTTPTTTETILGYVKPDGGGNKEDMAKYEPVEEGDKPPTLSSDMDMDG